MWQIATQPLFPLWVAIGAVVPFYLVTWSFRRNLISRREELEHRLGITRPAAPTPRLFTWVPLNLSAPAPSEPVVDPAVTERLGETYRRAFPQADPAKQFDRYYATVNYLPPLLCLTVMVIATWLLAFAQVRLGDPMGVAAIAATLGPYPILAAIAGYFWSVMDLLDRGRNNDLRPAAVHLLWSRLPISALFAPALLTILTDAAKVPVAIAIGLFPLRTIMQFLKARVPQVSGSPLKEDAPTLHLLQGMTEALQLRFAEDRIERVEHLVYHDPIKLSIRSNIEWELLIDLMDQSLLVQHIGEKIEKIRELGFRGGIDLAVAWEYLTTGDAASQQRTEAVLREIGRRLEVPYEGVVHLGKILYEDPLIAFLWAQWSDSRG
jgi:hypothetical protein